MDNCCKKLLFLMLSQCGELMQEGIFCDAEPVWSTVAERYRFVMWRQYGELLQEVMVLWYGASVENCCR